MKKKLLYNTISSFTFQILTIICGFILPRFFIEQYGSAVNGLVSSITQFLSIISFLEMGVGAVIQSSLYKPLAEKDIDGISAVHIASGKFFRKIACILAIYVCVLLAVYPFAINSEFNWLFTALLILAISISMFAQYCFGLADWILLTADQRGYIACSSQIATLILNTVACIGLMKLGAPIYVVKLTTSIIYLARPIIIRLYINSHYQIKRNIKFHEDPIKHKWDAVTQHIAHIVLNNTDTIVLTSFSTLTNVSIYSIYYMVVHGIKTLFLYMTNGIQPAVGEIWARDEREKLNSFFEIVEFTLHAVIVLVFTVTAILIVPFVSVYTKDIADVNYAQPVFAILLVMAYAVHCLRDPYHILIKAAGHFRQTSKCHIIAAVMNVVISVATVYRFGLVGVAIGTLVAMTYQTIWMAVYSDRNIVKGHMKKFIGQCAVDVICVTLIVISTCWLNLTEVSFLGWVVLAVKVFGIAAFVTAVVNVVFCRKKVNAVLAFLKSK